MIDIQSGTRVQVVQGRNFDKFNAGDSGFVVRTNTEANNCDVIFDGRDKPICVALRHLKVVIENHKLETCASLGPGAEIQQTSPRLQIDGASNVTETVQGICIVENTADLVRSNVKEVDQAVGVSFDSELGSVFRLGPLQPAYDGLYKWKGCALGSDGCLYCAPYGSSSVLVIDPHQQVLSHIEDAGLSAYKWSGIAAGADGCLYCAPCNASSVLVIDPQSRSLTQLGHVGEEEYKWSGIVAGSDGRLYCAPARADTVLVIDPVARSLSYIPGAGKGSSKWSGIAEGPDQLLYCAPSMATAVLVVDPRRRCLHRLEGAVDEGCYKYKWSGIARGADGRLYCSPYNASNVLIIDTLAGTLSTIEGAGEGECKWSGIATGLDGRLYCVPSRARSVLSIDPVNSDLGVWVDVDKGHSKWSGLCVGLDRWLCCVPYNASYVLAIKGGRTLRPQERRPRNSSKISDNPLGACDLGFADADPYAEEKEALRQEFAAMLTLPSGPRVTRYRELCRLWHPDKRPNEPELATAVFQYLQQLHERFCEARTDD
eukprot:TRINITY_DN37341_c0_g1_i1.p1 TRINITY_DN37341_c0_g1~~TRINITY_DN37341_c0_g1_i1.p1  ORF type:complete len:543 (+),score=63.96 TRINITY_DN37341_c0_g1_i1:99-1727(+)